MRAVVVILAFVVGELSLSSCARTWPAESESKEREMLALVNDVRETGATCPESGAQPAVNTLEWNDELAWAARDHATDMATTNYFAHEATDGRDPFERMSAAGYTGFPRAENIAAGHEDAASTFQQWMDSDGHCVNIMLDGTNELGVGYAKSEGADFVHYWVQNFGNRDE